MIIYTPDKMEKIVPLVEEKEVEEEIEAAEEEEDDDEDGTEKDDDVEEKETMPQAPDTTEKNILLPVKPKEKQQPNVLNLNNEVVKMRKEVKRVRALIIRKLTRHIGALKKKKGKETDIEKNQRRVARLLEEIHAMKVLSPDLVTKTALQKNLNFEQMCKNPKSTISDRATARIATHPQFNKKIEDIKAAVKAFKEERIKGGKEGGKEKVQNQAGKVTSQSPEKREERKHENEEEKNKVKQMEVAENEEGDDILIDIKKATRSANTAVVQKKVMPVSKSEKPVSVKSSEVKDNVKDKSQSKEGEGKPHLRPLPAALQKTSDSEESDLESSDGEEKEYFDDSTEERFHKQSSQSEESEDDDFFVGKVSKFKKKKKQKSVEERSENTHEVKKDSRQGLTSDKVQSELDETDHRLKSKATSVQSKMTSLQSVFCSSLSGSKHTRGGGVGGGAGSSRSGDKFMGQGKLKGASGNRDFSKRSKFQRQNKGTERGSVSSYSKPCPETEEKGFTSVGKGRGRGMFSHQATQQALHPSWEASRKRKEQQGQILAFQGKKIKFDDDD